MSHSEQRAILATLAGATRRETFDGKSYIVVPIVALVEGVIQAMNAPHAELVRAEKFSVAPGGWNGRPVFLGHPMQDGEPVSGNSPEVLSQSFGKVFNTRVDGRRLLMEAWLDPDKTPRALMARIEKDEKIEISIGAFTLVSDDSGRWEGAEYRGAWDTIIPDHLALLPEGTRGACSVEKGCGVRAAGGAGSGWFSSNGHVSRGEHIQDAHAHLEKAKEAMAKKGDARMHLTEARRSIALAHDIKPNIQTSLALSHATNAMRQHASSTGAGAISSAQRAQTLLRDARSIPQSERDKMDTSDFAGPGTSYPIKKPEDVSAAAHLVGKAADPAAVKKRIIAIAKRKGAAFVAQLPISWKAEMKGASMSVISKIKALLRAAGDAEEQAEMIGYKTLAILAEQAQASVGAVSSLVGDLMAAEAAEGPDTDEEAVEEAQLDSIHVFAMQAVSSLYAICQQTQALSRAKQDDPAPGGMSYMMGKEDLKVAEQVRDRAIAILGGKKPCGCGGGGNHATETTQPFHL